MATFIDNFFQIFDYWLLAFMHQLSLSWGRFLTPLAMYLDKFGEMPLALIFWVGVVLLFFRKYRRLGLLICVSMGVGIAINSLFLKAIVGRVRPYNSGVKELYDWWLSVGAFIEKTSSFPSGHSCAAMSGTMAFLLGSKNKKRYLICIYPLFMGLSRIYLMVHYPSDVIFGYLVGVAGGYIGWEIVEKFYKYLKENPDSKLYAFFMSELQCGQRTLQ